MSQHVRPSNCSNKMAGCMNASIAAESRQLCAQKKKSLGICTYPHAWIFHLEPECHQQHLSALASFANVLAYRTCVLPICYVGVKLPVIDLVP